jgi:hypothetical protein
MWQGRAVYQMPQPSSCPPPLRTSSGLSIIADGFIALSCGLMSLHPPPATKFGLDAQGKPSPLAVLPPSIPSIPHRKRRIIPIGPQLAAMLFRHNLIAKKIDLVHASTYALQIWALLPKALTA